MESRIVDDSAGMVVAKTAQTSAQSGDRTERGVPSIAEGAGLAHDAGNLLGALSLYSDLLAMPGVSPRRVSRVCD